MPPPPEPAPDLTDFTLELPGGLENGVTLEQWVPGEGRWMARTQPTVSWKCAWDTEIEDSPRDASGNVAVDEQGQPLPPFKLRDWLDNAFVIEEPQAGPRSYQDPDVVGVPEPFTDERVHNPTDAAFEAAVRGAMEQFRGSPFFRRDPTSEYEQLLERAYSDKTTVYNADGEVPDDPLLAEAVQKQQQAHEARGLIVHDMIADLRDYVAAVRAGGAGDTSRSVAFAMGLVFRVTGDPEWLRDPQARLTIRQRTRPSATAPDTTASGEVRTFNIPATDFASNPPHFERLQQLTDSRTIALAWDLVWPTPPENVTGAQADPEHHLVHYLVRRRALDGNDREVVFTVKGADTLHREPVDKETGAPGLLTRLKRRFQLVDHFADETLQDLAAIPVNGKRYLYSITPVDFAGNSGRPLSLVATRYPTEPPQVPVNGECVVHYCVDESTLDPASAVPPSAPSLVQPAALTVHWTDPPASPDAPSVPIATYQLVFRRDPTLPIGSYGLDSTTQRPPAKSLPTTNARPLPTDVKVVLSPHGSSDERSAIVSANELRQAGILPADGRYRPESWRVFFQTVSQNGVPSALAPVQLMLRVVAGTAATYNPLADPPKEREERRPAEIEWLPQPMKLPMLPPEDEAATVGVVHTPMLEGGDTPAAFVFDPQLRNIGYACHPAGLRCVRFRWNQGPSAQADYPLELNAGYHLLRLDIDACTTDTFSSAEKLAAALHTLQEVQMIPADELILTPGDTLAPTQWEAWYPSAIQRRREPAERAPGSEIPRAPWYSWRESVLEWPAWKDLTDGRGVRDSAFHPALDRLLALLRDPPPDQGPTPYRVEVQVGPPMQPGDLAAFLKSTAPSADPYGWGILQRLGLSVAFRLRVADTGDIVGGQDLLDALSRVLAYADAESVFADAKRYLHIELLFQPGRTFALEEGGVNASDLLALVQVSLRPAIRQTRKYARVVLEGKPGTTVPVAIVLDAHQACGVVDQGDPAVGQADLLAEAQNTAFIRRVRIPIGGRTALLLRAVAVPTIRIRLSEPVEEGFNDAFAPTLNSFEENRITYVKVTPFVPPVGADRRDEIAGYLQEADQDLAAVLAAVYVERFSATDDASSSFVVTPGALAADLVSGAAQPSWNAFRRYVEAISSTDADVKPERKLRVPMTREEVEKLVPDFVAWSQRFFDASAPMAPQQSDPELHQTAPGGPWMAAAYPRAGSPAHAAPDASGRLTYDQLVEDPWAHAYRFYVRPYGRYDLLWQSLRQSTVLFPGTPRLPDAAPDKDAGGLDVVLDRTRPVTKPLVLSSMRLDAPSDPASPAPPGPIWEVILAEHPEQTLVDHNQTLARQLAFRQVSYTLLRTFAYPAWVQRLSALVGSAIVLEPVEDKYPGLPGAYPEAPEHLALPPLASDDASILDLPLRIGPFQQGAMALQWEGLPFFYEHRLLSVAQTTSTVSPVNEIVQRDFEYVTPDPIAAMEPVETEWRPAGLPAGLDPIEIRARNVYLTLRKLWDSLPAAARDRWPEEMPDGVRRKPGWFPDLGVVYQLVEEFSGNVEVQAEVCWDEGAGMFARRQLGTRFLADLGALTPPEAATADDFLLALVVQQVTRQELSRAYDASVLALPVETLAKVSFEGKVLAFNGVMTHADRAALAAALDPAEGSAIQTLHDAWYAQEPVSVAPAIPPGLESVLDLPEPTETRLVWDGAMSEAEKAALLALPGDDELVQAVQRLAAAVGAGAGVVSVAAPLGPEQIPAALATQVWLTTDAASGHYSELCWGRRPSVPASTGNMSDADIAALVAWPRVRALRDAITALVAVADGTAYSVALPAAAPTSPRPEDLPPELAGRLIIELNRLSWKQPAPTDAERAALDALGGDSAFAGALAELLNMIDAERIDADRSVPMTPRRPRQQDLPDWIAGQLQIESDRVTWIGRLHDPSWREFIAALPGDPGDPDFTAAIQQILSSLDAQVLTVPFTVAARPAAEALGVLEDKLIIGRAVLRYHGLMTGSDVQAVAGGFTRAADRRAVRRLYDRTLKSGMRGRELKMRTRRGSAPPSDLAAIPPIPPPAP